MAGFSLKLKTKSGQHIVSNLAQNTTLEKLKTKIAELTKIPENGLHVVFGFPPFKPIDMTKNDELLSAVGISNGDTLIVEEKTISEAEKKQLEEQKRIQEDERLALELSDENSGVLLKKVVPADNSCLFSSIGFALTGKIDTANILFMREIIAAHVNEENSEYNEGILGRPNDEYGAWILQPESWGGAIEVSILAQYHGVEIDVVDISNAIINRFGEDKNYGMRIFLLFDGIHYDPLYLESTTGGAPKTMFQIENNFVYMQAEQLAQEAKSSRQFTDVNKFTLRCGDCDCYFKGQTEAQQHAVRTGHINFGEV